MSYTVAARTAAKGVAPAPAQACCHVPKVHGNCSRAKLRCKATEVKALNEQVLFDKQPALQIHLPPTLQRCLICG